MRRLSARLLEGSRRRWRFVRPGLLEIGFDYGFLLPSIYDRVPCVCVENYRVLNFDPVESKNIIDQQPEIARSMEAQLQAIIRARGIRDGFEIMIPREFLFLTAALPRALSAAKPPPSFDVPDDLVQRGIAPGASLIVWRDGRVPKRQVVGNFPGE